MIGLEYKPRRRYSGCRRRDPSGRFPRARGPGTGKAVPVTDVSAVERARRRRPVHKLPEAVVIRIFGLNPVETRSCTGSSGSGLATGARITPVSRARLRAEAIDDEAGEAGSVIRSAFAELSRPTPNPDTALRKRRSS